MGILLAISVTISSGAELPESPTSELGKAPPAPPWLTDSGEPPDPVIIDGGVMLPGPLGNVVFGRLVYLDEIYPRLCQSAIDAWGQSLRRAGAVEIRQAEADAAAAMLDRDQSVAVAVAEASGKLPQWAVAFIATGALFLGGFLGYMLGTVVPGL